jgi:dephospho-CoA kinase
MIVQVIGLPCSGKTTAIKEFLKTNNDIIHLDIRNSKSESQFRQLVKRHQNKNLIVESATGFNLKSSRVIRMNVDYPLLYERSVKRDKTFDEDYLSLLETVMLRTKYTANSKQGLIVLLTKFFKS